MMRGGTLLILGHGVKGQGQLWNLVGTIATTVFAQSLSNFTCKLWMMRGGTVLILGHGIKGQGQLATTVFAQSLSNFTCKLWMMRGGTLLILGHWVKGQGQLWNLVGTPYETNLYLKYTWSIL